MSITIFDSQTKYSSVTVQTMLNEMAELWDTTNWKNSQGKSIAYEDGSTDVKELYLSDYITIGKTTATSPTLQITHSSGATRSPGTMNARFVIAKSEHGMVIHNPTSHFYLGIGKTIDESGEENWGLVTRGTTGQTDSLYCFTKKMQSNSANNDFYICTTMRASTYYTVLSPIYSTYSDERFEEGLFFVRPYPMTSQGKCELNGVKYYIGRITTTNDGVLALKYT